MNAALEQMLTLVRTREREEREAMLTRAQDESRRILAEARRDARARVGGHLAQLRHLMRRELNRAQAALETERRQHQSRCDFAVLEAGWMQLRAALALRWLDSAGRAAWIGMLVAQALASLPRLVWEISHPEDWPQAEREALARRLERELGYKPRLAGSSRIRAGILIRARSASLDGTLDGLLLDRHAVESQLLAELDRS